MSKLKILSRDEVIEKLNDAYDNMQDDPELECVDTLSLMEEAVTVARDWFKAGGGL